MLFLIAGGSLFGRFIIKISKLGFFKVLRLSLNQIIDLFSEPCCLQVVVFEFLVVVFV